MKTGGAPEKDLTVGFNSSMKLMKSGGTGTVYLASDCSPFIKEKVVKAAQECGAALITDKTMAQLGAMCGIDVGCAVCAARN